MASSDSKDVYIAGRSTKSKLAKHVIIDYYKR